MRNRDRKRLFKLYFSSSKHHQTAGFLRIRPVRKREEETRRHGSPSDRFEAAGAADFCPICGTARNREFYGATSAKRRQADKTRTGWRREEKQNNNGKSFLLLFFRGGQFVWYRKRAKGLANEPHLCAQQHRHGRFLIPKRM